MFQRYVVSATSRSCLVDSCKHSFYEIHICECCICSTGGFGTCSIHYTICTKFLGEHKFQIFPSPYMVVSGTYLTTVNDFSVGVWGWHNYYLLIIDLHKVLHSLMYWCQDCLDLKTRAYVGRGLREGLVDNFKWVESETPYICFLLSRPQSLTVNIVNWLRRVCEIPTF